MELRQQMLQNVKKYLMSEFHRQHDMWVDDDKDIAKMYLKDITEITNDDSEDNLLAFLAEYFGDEEEALKDLLGIFSEGKEKNITPKR